MGGLIVMVAAPRRGRLLGRDEGFGESSLGRALNQQAIEELRPRVYL